ncbi:hypothetical protein ABIC71_000675 [Herbaspirillum seropedicae]|uniref:hypothetical protein n=1 Tax=Herbaspirillum seropedicae TaxID=964 RepID=UPI00339B711E
MEQISKHQQDSLAEEEISVHTQEKKRLNENSQAGSRHPQVDREFVDNRPTSQRHATIAQMVRKEGLSKPAPRAVIQRAVGVVGDNDRQHISVEDLQAGDTVNVRNLRNRRTAGEIIANSFTVNGQDTTGAKLKHYMVAKSGTRYQLPIKHLRAPRRFWNGWAPNQGDADAVRGGMPEPFGGNHDLDPGQVLNDHPLANSRDTTLATEYEEEGHPDRQPVGAGVFGAGTRSKKYHVNHGGYHAAGTLSIVNLADPADIQAQRHPNQRYGLDDRGRAEMAGTISVDCADLIGANNPPQFNPQNADDLRDEKERIEDAIGAKINVAYQAFHNPNQVGDPFAASAGILAHLVTMMAEDVYEARMARLERQAQQEAAALEQQRQELELQRQLALRAHPEDRQGAENRVGQQAQQSLLSRLPVWLIGVALFGILLAWLINR